MAKANKNNKGMTWIITGIVAVVIVVIGGVLLYNYMSTPANVSVSENQSTIEVKKGQQFTISLSSNPTTGYGWSVDDTYDKNMLTKVSDEYIATDTGLTGSGGTEKWTFKANNTGTTTLNFRYIRPWEGNSSQVNSKTYTVTAK